MWKNKIYTNKDLFADCIELIEAYIDGSISLDALDTNGKNLIGDIKFKYPRVAWYDREDKK